MSNSSAHRYSPIGPPLVAAQGREAMLFLPEVSRVFEVAVLIVVHAWSLYHLCIRLFQQKAR